jgi:hypothetical protein
MVHAGVDPVLGFRLYQAVWNVTATIRQSFSMQGVVNTAARALDAASPGSNIGDPLRSLSNTTGHIVQSVFETSGASEAVYSSLTSIKKIALILSQRNGKRAEPTRNPLQPPPNLILSQAQSPSNANVRRALHELHAKKTRRGALSVESNASYARSLQSIDSLSAFAPALVKSFIGNVFSQCLVLDDAFFNIVNGSHQMVRYYSSTFADVDMCNVRSSFSALSHTYDGFERRRACNPRLANETEQRLSITTAVIDFIKAFSLHELFGRSVRDTDETTTPFTGSSRFSGFNFSTFRIPEMHNTSFQVDTARGGFTHDIARLMKAVGVDAFTYATDLISAATMQPNNSQSWFWRYVSRLFQCDYVNTMECQSVSTADLLQGLLATFALGIIGVVCISTYVPSVVRMPVMAIAALVSPFIAIMTILFVSYGESPMCFLKTYGSPIFMLPYCLMNDIYDLIDVYIFPRHIDWGAGLVSRTPTNDFSIDARNATMCVASLGFDDGFHNIGYLVQRFFGNDYLDRNGWIQYVSVYPLHNAMTAFQHVDLQPNDIYEHCFWITILNVIPSLLLIGLVFQIEFAIVYVAWSFLSASNIFVRDVRNTAIYYGMFNEDMKNAYAVQEGTT